MGLALRSRHGKARAAAGALLLFAAASVWAPLAHAHSEQVRSAATVESDHSAQCPTLHDEAAWCQSGHLVGPGASSPTVSLPEVSGRTAARSEPARVQLLERATPRTRAPPTTGPSST